MCVLANPVGKLKMPGHQVESAFRAIPQAQPAPGFTSRWQAHLAEYLAHKQKRRGWMMIGLNVVIIISLLVLVVTQLWSLIQAPGPYLVAWFTRLFSLVTIYFTLQDIFRSFPGSIPFIVFRGNVLPGWDYQLHECALVGYLSKT